MFQFLINMFQVLGGTSVMNGMMYMRGSRADYDSWAAAGNEGWSYDEVLPYFLRSEDNKQVCTVITNITKSFGIIFVKSRNTRRTSKYCNIFCRFFSG